MEELINAKQVQEIRVENLHLDTNNPRFGDLSDSDIERDIVNHIVKNFGVTDILSSLSVNGYFNAEPIICRKESNDRYTVIEGNRRLTACLILSDDQRAIDQTSLRRRFRELQEQNHQRPIELVPAIVFEKGENEGQLLSYLGVRHIVSTKDWDSYAKASWVHRVVSEPTNNLSLDDIARMIGDTRRTVHRLMQGYGFVSQLQKEGRFNPENSQRKGRGSNTQYPFSWVYTILGYESVKNFVGLNDDPSAPEPIANDKLDDASLVVQAMFGNKQRGVDSAINDSREIGDLAKVLSSSEQVYMLKNGKKVKSILRDSAPLEELAVTLLMEVDERLSELNSRIEVEDLTQSIATRIQKRFSNIKRRVRSFDKELTTALTGDDEGV